MTSADIHALAGAYALDALPEDEERVFETHLADCEPCQQEVAELRVTAAQLGHVAAEPAPAGLRERLLAEIDVIRQGPPPLASPQSRSERVSARPRGVLVGAAAAVIVIFGLTAVVARLNARIDQLQAETAAAYRVLSADDVRSIELAGNGNAQGRLIVSQDGSGLLVVEGLKPVGREQVYELWFIASSGPQPAGLFRPGDAGRAVHLLTGADLTAIHAVGITLEPRGGSRQPTSNPVLTGEV